MAQEEQQKCSNSSSGGGGGGRSSKKLKQKKIPQRGLGVAQLEKIRLEEQHKKEAVAAAVVAPSPFVPAPIPHHHHQSSSSFPFPTHSTDLSPSSAQNRPSSSISLLNFDLYGPPPSVPPQKTTLYGQNTSNPPSGGGSAIGGSAATMAGHGYFPFMWNHCKLNYDGEVPKLDPGFTFRPHLRNVSSPFLPPSVTVQRKPPPPYSKVNVSSTTSSSSGLNLQMEPPSNQSYHSNYIPPLLPDEEKVLGVKRPWPFSLDCPQDPSTHCKFPPFIPPIYRFDESSSWVNGTSFYSEQGNGIFREGPSGSGASHVDWRGGSTELDSNKGCKESGQVDTLLTLAPSATTSSSKSCKAKQPIEFPASSHCEEFSEFNMLPYQRYTEDSILQASGSVQQQPFYSFLPTKGQQIGLWTATSNDRRSEAGDGVDLNLKL